MFLQLKIIATYMLKKGVSAIFMLDFCLRPSWSETNKSECDWLPPSLPDSLPDSGRFVEIHCISVYLYICISV